MHLHGYETDVAALNQELAEYNAEAEGLMAGPQFSEPPKSLTKLTIKEAHKVRSENEEDCLTHHQRVVILLEWRAKLLQRLLSECNAKVALEHETVERVRENCLKRMSELGIPETRRLDRVTQGRTLRQLPAYREARETLNRSEALVARIHHDIEQTNSARPEATAELERAVRSLTLPYPYCLDEQAVV